MKLYYFNFPGLAEISRILLKASGTDFEDIRYSGEEWEASYKAMSPTGKCPFLQLDDGTIICQSQAIEGYIANTAGLQPRDAVDAAKMWMLVECFRDIGASLRPTMQMPDEEKGAARKALFAPDGAVAAQFQVIEKLLAERGSEYAVTDSLTLADVHAFKHVSFYNSGQLDGIEKGTLAAYPKLLELRDKVARLPQVAVVYAGCQDDPSRSYYMP